jgi:hypothetical protein
MPKAVKKRFARGEKAPIGDDRIAPAGGH